MRVRVEFTGHGGRPGPERKMCTIVDHNLLVSHRRLHTGAGQSHPEISVSIHVALNHVTHYTYDRLVNLSPQVVRLRPAPHCRTRILSYSLKVEPANHFVNWMQDPFSNHLARLVFPDQTQEFKIT